MHSRPKMSRQLRLPLLFAAAVALPAGAILTNYNFARSRPLGWPAVAKTSKFESLGLAVAPEVLDLDTDSTDGNARGEFLIKNITGSPITIDSVVPSCGCTTVLFSLAKIQPGESVRVPVSVSLAAVQSSEFEKLITVNLGTPFVGSSLSLVVKGRKKDAAGLKVIPGAIDLGTIQAGLPVRRRIYLKGDSSLLSSLPKEVLFRGSPSVAIILERSGGEGAEGWASTDIVIEDPELYWRTADEAITLKILAKDGSVLGSLSIHGRSHSPGSARTGADQ